MIQRKLEVTYLPFDRSTRVPPGTTLFSAAHWIGLPIDSTCGGRGTCGKCKVRVLGNPPEVTTADHRQLRQDEIDGGWRLSCQARIYEDIRCEVPQLLRVPKAATMGLGRLVILDPNVRKVYLQLEAPTLEDQRSDVVRLRDALAVEGHDMVAPVPVLRSLPTVLRAADFKVTAVLAGETLVAVEPGDTTGDCFGIAFDVGTTTLVGTLMNLRTGMAASVHSTLNGQAPFGADVISRISHAMNGLDSVRELQAAVIATMNQVIAQLYAEAGVGAERTYEAVVVGNVTMLHLLLGIDPAPIAVMPFTPAFMEPIAVMASEIGLDIHPHGYVQTLPALGAYVGADVISRISHAMNGLDAVRELQAAVIATMNQVVAQLYAEAGVGADRTYEAVVVGNVTMLHLLLGIDPAPIAVMPFTPAFMEPIAVMASEIGLDIHPHGYVQTLPALGAYVGADIVAGVLATNIARDEKLRVFVDVGTNGEIVIGSAQRTLATAAPAGPAFEGSQIKCGMRATDGAIEGVQLGDKVELQIIGGDVKPVGICGSGLVDAVAQMLLVGILDHSGRMKSREDLPHHPLADRLIEVEGVRAFLLADGVYLTQRDVRELQFAKGSIATGIKVLMDIMGMTTANIDEIYLGGSFGSYLNPESAKIIGLVPPVDVDKIIAVGNSAGEGAKIALLSYRERQVAFELPSRLEYVELSGRADFNDTFVEVLKFPVLEPVS